MTQGSIPTIFSRARRRAALDRARRQQGTAGGSFLAGDFAEDVIDRLGFIRFEPASALVVGDANGALTRHLQGLGAQVTPSDATKFEEEAPYPFGPFDFIASFGSLGTLNDLPGALVHIRNALAPGGLAMVGFPGAGSLPVLRQALLAADAERPAARLHPQVDCRAGAELMQRTGFARQVADTRTVQVGYRSFDRLIADLRAQGLTNVLASAPPPLTRTQMAVARDAFMAQADEQGRVVETFEVLTLTGWKS